MSDGANILERAFALAEDGIARDMADLRHYLLKEGFSKSDLRHLQGQVMLKQLMLRISAAKAEKLSHA